MWKKLGIYGLSEGCWGALVERVVLVSGELVSDWLSFDVALVLLSVT
jgi:hypothetical protein